MRGRFRVSCRRRYRGFTLVELLVVVVIVGVMVTALLLSVSVADIGRLAGDRARQLEDLLALNCEQAVLDNAARALHLDQGGYHFLYESYGGWQMSTEKVFRSRQLEPQLELALELDGREVILDEQLELKPHLICFSSGEATPFEIQLRQVAGETLFRLEGQLDGRVTRMAAHSNED